MRVLYLTQYFPPEIGATQSRAREMALGLARAGHSVTVLTEFPNHPTGVIPPEYHGKRFVREKMDGLDVIRVWVKTSPRKSAGGRLAFYLSFAAMAGWAGLFVARGRYDVAYVSSPPLFVGIPGLLLGLRGIPMVFEVRDLWPESALELGELRPGIAAGAARALASLCYRRARRVVAVTEGIRRGLRDAGVEDDRITVIPNGANLEVFRPGPADAAVRTELGFAPQDFLVGYTGLHGLAHGLETLLEAAERLRDHEHIVFLLVGDGPRKEALRRIASERGLGNVRFVDALPEPDLARLLPALDLAVDTRRKLAITRGTLPVKMFSAMACARPVLLAIEGEAADLVRSAGCGRTVPPEDAESFASAVLELEADPEGRRIMGERGRRWVEEHYSRDRQAADLAQLLQGARRPGS